MRLNKILAVLPLALVVTLAATPAFAQRGVIGISKVGHHSSVNIGIGIGVRPFYPRPIVDCYRPVVIVEPCRRWYPPCYETQCYEVWVPGCESQIWIEPVYQTVCDPCCGTRTVLVSAGYFKTVIGAGHYETRHRQILVRAGYYA